MLSCVVGLFTVSTFFISSALGFYDAILDIDVSSRESSDRRLREICAHCRGRGTLERHCR
jgi:hypothetical protein